MTITPPSSDRWISEESTPNLEPVSDRDGEGWMHRRLGQAMSGIDFLDLDGVAEPSAEQDAAAVPTNTDIAKAKSVSLSATHDIHSLSLGMDDTLDIVKNAMAAQAAQASSSSRTESKKGRPRSGLGVSFANADEINEFHAYPSQGQHLGLEIHEELSDEEQGHAKTPIANPAGGWMRRLEKAYSYGG